MPGIHKFLMRNKNLLIFIILHLVYFFLLFWRSDSVVVNCDSSLPTSNGDNAIFFLWDDNNFGLDKSISASFSIFYLWQYFLSFLPLFISSKLSLFLGFPLLNLSLLKLVKFNFNKGSTQIMVVLSLFVLSLGFWNLNFRLSQEVFIYGLAFIALSFLNLRRFLLDYRRNYKYGIYAVLFASLFFHPSLLIMAFVLFCLYLTFYLFNNKKTILDKLFWLKLFSLIIIFLLLNSYFIFPLIYRAATNGIENGLSGGISSVNLFFAVSNNVSFYSNLVFLDEKNFVMENWIFSLFSFGVFIWVIFINFAKISITRYRAFVIFSFLFFHFLALGSNTMLGKIYGLFFDKIPLSFALRQPNKYVYIIILLFFVLFNDFLKYYLNKNKRILNFLVMLFLILGFVSILRNYQSLRGFNFPRDYVEYLRYFNNERGNLKVIVLPYINYPTYKEIKGTSSFTDRFLNRPVDYYSDASSPRVIKQGAYDSIKKGINPVHYFNRLGVTHIVFHKDYYFEKNINEKERESEYILSRLKIFFKVDFENDSIAVLKTGIDDPYLEEFSLENTERLLRNMDEEMVRKVLEINQKKDCKISGYEKINPVYYKLNFESSCETAALMFKNSYYRGWKMYEYGSDNFLIAGAKSFIDGNKNLHFKLDESNVFMSKFSEPRKSVIIYFEPQIVFYLGIGESGIIFLACLGYLVFDWRKRRKEAKIIKLNS